MKNFAIVLFLIICAPCWAMTKTYFVSPTGNDTNSGESQRAAFKSIGKALDAVYNSDYSAKDVLTIRISNGLYRGQFKGIVLKNSLPTVRIIGDFQNKKRPIFSDGGLHKEWLTLYAKKGQKLNLSIENLEIRKYFSVLSIIGNRDSPREGNQGIVIKNNIFRSIGSQPSNSKGRVAFGAIRFINSSNNIVTNNKFIDIRNSEVCGGLHAIYLAHFSSNNKIVNNIFDGACGSSIKFRDRSNGNIVESNKFVNLENVPAIEEWFCDRAVNKDCKKPTGECPSTSNVERDNQFPENVKSAISVVGRKIPRKWCSTSSFTGLRIMSR